MTDFIKVQCTECKEILSVDKTMKKAVCLFCGEPFNVKEARNYYEMYNSAGNNTADARMNFIIEGGVLKKYVGTSSTVIIPAGVKSIGEKAFFSCESITSVLVPEGVTSIGVGAFFFCKRLETIILPASVRIIGFSAFSCCMSLESIRIPNGVTDIGEGAFDDCKSLSDVIISKELLLASKNAFSKDLYNKLMNNIG